MPELKAKAEKDLDGNVLATALKAMVSYCATETDRPILNGVALYLGEKMAVASGDGFRMGYQELPLSFPVEETVDIPATSVAVLESLWSKMPMVAAAASTLVQQITAKRQLHFSLNGNTVSFRFGRATLVTKLIEGKPPNFKELIPTPTNKIKVMGPDMMGVLRRLKGVAKDVSWIVRMKWEGGAMTLSSQAEEKGKVEVTIPAVTDDGSERTAINLKYLLEYFTGKEDFVTMGISGENTPVLFSYRHSPLVLMMPMFVQW